MIEKYRDGVIPAKTEGDANLKKLWEETKKSALIAILGFGYSDCLVTIWNFINAANKYIEDSRPWEAAKSAAPEDVKRLDEILYSLAECIRLSTILVFPFMPVTAKKVFEQLGIIKDFDMDLSLAEYGNWGDFEGNTKTGKRDILFPRIESEKAI
jgi:methionyl-tRNA synthetase